jgi:hypothetical protein
MPQNKGLAIRASEINKEKQNIPSMRDIEMICRVYLTGNRNHHRQIEIDAALTNRRYKPMLA